MHWRTSSVRGGSEARRFTDRFRAPSSERVRRRDEGTGKRGLQGGCNTIRDSLAQSSIRGNGRRGQSSLRLSRRRRYFHVIKRPVALECSRRIIVFGLGVLSLSKNVHVVPQSTNCRTAYDRTAAESQFQEGTTNATRKPIDHVIMQNSVFLVMSVLSLHRTGESADISMTSCGRLRRHDGRTAGPHCMHHMERGAAAWRHVRCTFSVM